MGTLPQSRPAIDHGGRRWVTVLAATLGAPGEGSTFWFELSLKRADGAELPRISLDPQNLIGRRALIVDDNATNRRILVQQFLSVGVETVEAVDAYHALELAAAAADAGEAFDLGVIDLNMPGMDGIELASRLKANPATASTILFLLSSSGERLGSAESHLRGFAGCMTKPVRSSELFDSLITGINGGVPVAAPKNPAATPPENQEVIGMILLVEDNTMNQLVASKVLAKLGYTVEIADHGGEAIAAVQAGSYDAILMDCQMPEMDGYEATSEIRRIEGGARRIPIIAMTAAAMDGDRARCIAAGMDDYITKPVRPEAVAAVLARWVVPAAPDAADADATLPADEEAPDILDQAQIEILLSLDDGVGAVLGEIIDEYLTSTDDIRGELIRGIDETDAVVVERAAHKLRGMCSNVGAAALSSVCAEIETLGRLAELDGAARLLERFDTQFARVRDALDQVTTTTTTVG